MLKIGLVIPINGNKLSSQSLNGRGMHGNYF